VRIFLLQFLKNHSGTTAIEYSIIAAGIALAILVALGQLGSSVSAQYQAIDSALQ
jgi:pilus assembly protein Flp/PilA